MAVSKKQIEQLIQSIAFWFDATHEPGGKNRIGFDAHSKRHEGIRFARY